MKTVIGVPMPASAGQDPARKRDETKSRMQPLVQQVVVEPAAHMDAVVINVEAR